MAQLLNLGSDEYSENLSPWEIELRRRAWWTLCCLEKRCAEDAASRPASIMDMSNCSLPLNVNDDDLDPAAFTSPIVRSGITDMTFCLMRFEMLRLFLDIFGTKPDATIVDLTQRQISLNFRKETVLGITRVRLDKDCLRYCNNSRPFDWFIRTFTEGFLVSINFTPKL